MTIVSFFLYQEGRSRDTVMLVDRYKYFDLMPCSSVELKLMGHPVSSSIILLFNPRSLGLHVCTWEITLVA